MTNKRAIEMLRNELACVRNTDCERAECKECQLVMPEFEVVEALRMAIKALEQNYDEEWRKEHYKNSYCQGFYEAMKMVQEKDKQEPCEDCISRQAVLDEAFEVDTKEYGRIDVVGVDAIVALPPITPQPKIGHCRDCK